MTETTTRPRSVSAAPTHREIVTIIGGLMIGMFLAALDQTVVTTAIRTIGDDLDGLSLQAWVTTAYLLTSTISTPLYGKLSDLHGRKPYYLIAVGMFVLGSLLSGTSQSMYQLAAWRGVQGLGAGGLMSLAITILGDLVAPRERARYQAYFLAVWGTSSVLGPVVGGFFAGAHSLLGITGWRWVFLINVPLGLLGIAVIARVLHLPPMVRTAHRIDWPGAVALVVGLVPLLVVAEQGRSWGWSSASALVCYGIGVVGIGLFLAVEARAGADAILPLRLFRNRTFAFGAGANFAIGVGMFGGMATLPLYLQIVRGMSPTAAGLALVPFTVGIMAGSVASGQAISRTGRYKVFPAIGTVLMLLGSLAFSILATDTPWWQIYSISVVFGLGLGFVMQPLVLAVQNAVPVTEMGVATSSSLFFRQMGGTLGTAVFLSILFSTLGDNIAAAIKDALGTEAFRAALTDPAVTANPANRSVLAALKGGPMPSFDDSSFLSALDPRLAHPFLAGFSVSIDTVMLVAAGVMVVGIALVLLIPELPLRQMSGIQGRLAEQDGDDPLGDGRGESTAGDAEAVAPRHGAGPSEDTSAESPGQPPDAAATAPGSAPGSPRGRHGRP